MAERAPVSGDVIGHYRILGVMGDGGLGRLYVAEQHGIQGVSKTVALKHIRPELTRSPDFRALFFDAASIAPRFEHPNVVTIHEMAEVGGSYFFSTEYLPGENIAAILKACGNIANLPTDIAASVVKQATNAVQSLHDLRRAAAQPVGLGHVDPSNVFVTYHGTVKVLGIGLRPLQVVNAAAASGAHRVGSTGFASAYVAPEQLAGSADARADVFSLGALLWTCLTGQSPELAHGDGEVGASASAQRWVAPSSLRADVPEALDVITLRALSPDPSERFQSARALSDALDQYLLRRGSRPTPKQLRRWMEQLFDAERASLQMQLAQGRDVEVALSLLGNLQPASGASNVAHSRVSLRPRELWSTSQAMFSRLERGSIAPSRSLEGRGSASHERLSVGSLLPHHVPSSFTGGPTFAPAMPTTSIATPAIAIATPATVPPATLASATAESARPPRTWMVALLIASCAVIAVGTALMLSSSERSPVSDASRDTPLADRSGRIDVRSTPEGAAVFVDGEPTGLRTPAVLKGLADGRKLMLRVDKAGFASQEREVQVVAGAVEARAFELLASDGLVRFAGAPADARIYIDEKAVTVEEGEPVSLSAGQHQLRVETPSSLIFSGTVVVVAGEQTIRVDGVEATP